MTLGAINRALAEWMGILVPEVQWPYSLWPDAEIAKISNKYGIPNFYGSLDAVAEVEARLTPEQWSRYCRELESVVRIEVESTFPQWRELSPSQLIDVLLIRATAPQRCEALLNTLGLWEEDV